MMDINEIGRILDAFQYKFSFANWQGGKRPEELSWQHIGSGCFLLCIVKDGKVNGQTTFTLSSFDALAVAQAYKYRWIKLSEAKPEEMPGNGEIVQVLARPGHQEVDRWLCLNAAYRTEEGGFSFFQKYFSWAVVTVMLMNPDKYASILNNPDTAIANVEYFRRLNWEDMPAFEPRKKLNI